MKRILFTEQNFIELIKGKVIEVDEVQIALQDIGYDRMQVAINNVRRKPSPPAPPKNREGLV